MLFLDLMVDKGLLRRGLLRRGLIPGLGFGWHLVIAGAGLPVLRVVLAALHEPNCREERGERMDESRGRTVSKREYLKRRTAGEIPGVESHG